MCGVLLIVTGCAISTDHLEEVRAVLADERASHSALQSTLDAIFRRHVPIAPDALTRSSQLTLELKPRSGLGDPTGHGRILVAPLQFTLVTDGRQCILIDQRSGTRHVLPTTGCTIE